MNYRWITETFILFFFGIFLVRPKRYSKLLIKAIYLLHLIGLILNKIIFCGLDNSVLRDSIFYSFFLKTENYLYIFPALLSLGVLLIKNRVLVAILKDLTAASASLRTLFGETGESGEASMLSIWTFHLLYMLALSHVGICLVIKQNCYHVCTLGALFIDYYTFIVVALYSLIIIKLKHLISAINKCLLSAISKSLCWSSPRKSLKLLRSLHFSCCDIGQKLNSCFTGINLASLMVEFLIVVSSLTQLPYTSNRIDCAFWAYRYGLTFFMKIYYSAGLYHEADKTAYYLQELCIENDDVKVKDEIEIFSLQLLHRRVEFDACGFFKLDFALLNSMIGAVTTYIVILIQFHSAGRNNSCEITNSTTSVI